jgi:hypothetical protein
MNPKYRLLIIILFFTTIVNAQTDFRKGYIIKSEGDTVLGFIDYRDDKLMSMVCKFKANENSEVITYNPTDIQSFRFPDSKFYISKEIDGKVYFLRFLLKGKVNIYSMRDAIGDHYYIEKEGAGIRELPYEEAVRYDRSRPYLYTSKVHIGILKALMADAPQTSKKINAITKPESGNLIRIAKNYHHEVCSNEECIIYENKLPRFRILVEPFGGVVYALNNLYQTKYNQTFNLQTGILCHLMLPQINEKIYFRLGLLYSAPKTKLLNYYQTVNVYKIPIQLEYIYPRGILRPKAALGINIYNPTSFSYSMMGGVNIKLVKSLDLSINYDIDFLNNYISKTLNYKTNEAAIKKGSQSLSAGLCIKF